MTFLRPSGRRFTHKTVAGMRPNDFRRSLVANSPARNADRAGRHWRFRGRTDASWMVVRGPLAGRHAASRPRPDKESDPFVMSAESGEGGSTAVILEVREGRLSEFANEG